MLTFLLAQAASSDAVSATAAITLVCGGAGTATKPTASSAYAYDNSGNSANATVYGRRSEAFEDQVDLVIDGENSRIRLPRTMLPPIKGGKDGWFSIKDIKVSPESFSGSAKVNFINHPSVYVDRRTGTISINGKGGTYTGRCERVETGAPTKF